MRMQKGVLIFFLIGEKEGCVFGHIASPAPYGSVDDIQYPDHYHVVRRHSLRKHAYSNKLKILPPKNANFQMKNSDIFHISALKIDCGYSLEPPRQGGSNEYQ